MAYNQLDLYHLELINQARAHPGATAAALDIDLNEGLEPGTILNIPKPPLVLNASLRLMAVAHTQDMIDNDFFSHDSPSTGLGTQGRFDNSIYSYTAFAENLGIVPTSFVEDDYEMALLMFEALFLDTGVEGRGHRLSILDGTLRDIGIGHLVGDWQGNTLTHVLTQAFGLSTNAVKKITGFVLGDSNQNGKYDVGEGLSGITVDIEEGGNPVASDTTDAWGYYDIQVDTGTYDVIARTLDHDVSEEDIEVTNENVKVDIYWDENITNRPSGTFFSNYKSLKLLSVDPTVSSLNPINVVDGEGSEYILSWSIADANIVYLDDVVVEASGSLKKYATNAITHVLRAYGPGGTLRLVMPITISVFSPFNSGDPDGIGGSFMDIIHGGGTGSKTKSGLSFLYGPSEETPVKIKTPDNLYVRIARVERVSAISRELDIRFIDGIIPMTDLYRAEVLFGVYNRLDDEGEPIIDTPTPSASVVGKGDRVAVMIEDDTYYVVSKLDRFEYPNNNRAAVYPYNLLYDALSTFCIGAHFVEDGYSFADFYNFENETVTRIECEAPNLETNRIPRRLLRRLAFTHLQNVNLIYVDDPSWPYEQAGGGAMTTQPILINDTIRHKECINNIPYVVNIPFGQDDYVGDLSAFSSVLENVDKALCHPLAGDTIENHYRGATYLWFDDPDPEWLLIIATYPSRNLAPYIKFIEVPVYGWSERARNDDEDDDEVNGVIETGSDRVNYLRYSELIREIEVITRTWIDWNAYDNSIYYSESIHRALAVPAVKVDINQWKFAIHDGFGYSNGSEIYRFANEQRLIYGNVTRSLRTIEEDGTALATNGSPYKYTISHNDPNAAAAIVSLWYDVDFTYFSDGASDIWETQKTTEDIEKKAWIIYTNGHDQLFKKIHIDYFCDGEYAAYPWQYNGQWQGDVDGVHTIINTFREYIYWNSTANLVATYEYDFTYDEASHEFRVVQSIPAVHYANIELGLFILEILEMNVMNTLGFPALLLEGTRNRKFVVWYKGTEYVLFNVEIPFEIGEDIFPAMYNFWPWSQDANTPSKPESGAYDIFDEHSTVFFVSPFCNYYVEPLDPYVYRAVSYPTMQGDVSAMLFVGAINPEEEDLKSDYIQIFFDPKTNNWGVTIKNILEIPPVEDPPDPYARTVTFPDGGGSVGYWPHGTNTLFKIGPNPPSFSKPGVDKIITL